ncbi:hypothetical protein [Methylibium sp.]|jgi:hypothetical protein|uniref:hypothetical protein n=1 Tax=Methylibium sp. TaxID=2067992 RepID=UPI003D0BC792
MRGKSIEWTQRRSYLVPRDLQVTLPKGYTWASTVRTYPLGPSVPEVTIAAADWGPEVAPLVRMVMVVAAVSAEVVLKPGKGSRSGANLERLKVRRAVSWRFEASDCLRVHAVSSRAGEVVVAPLRVMEAL